MDVIFWLGMLSEWLGAIAVTMIAGVAPIFKKVRQIEYRFPQREATFALSVFALIYLVAFQYFSNPVFGFVKEVAAVFAGGELAERMFLAVICLVPFILALVFRGQPLKSFGWGKDNFKVGVTLGLLLVVVTIFLRGKFTIAPPRNYPGTGQSVVGLVDAGVCRRIHFSRIYPGQVELSFRDGVGMVSHSRVICIVAVAR